MRIDGIQGAVLSVKLRYMDGWNRARKEITLKYEEYISGIEGIILPSPAPYASHVYHFMHCGLVIEIA